MKKQFSIEYIVSQFGGELIGENKEIMGVASIENAGFGQISFIADEKYKSFLKKSAVSAIILSKNYLETSCDLMPNTSYIVTQNVFDYFCKVVRLFHPKLPPNIPPHSLKVLGENVYLPESVVVGNYVVIGKNVSIGKNVFLGHGTVIGDDVEIGENTQISACVTIQNSRIGKNCIIASGVVIGSDGFGYYQQNGEWREKPHIGSVIIGDKVEIGANTTIDRGMVNDTVIEDGVKLDNLIQIGHNCKIGKHTVIAACTGIAGSVTVGNYCQIGGSVRISPHLSIADHVIISPTTFVTKNILKKGRYTALLPFQEHQMALNTAVYLKQLNRKKTI